MIEFQLDDKTFTLHETSAAAAEAAADRAESAAETLSGSVAQIATNTQDITALKEDLSYINTDIDVGYNIFNPLQLSGNNGAVTSNGDGSYTVGTTDYGKNWFGGAVNVKAGSYLLYGVPQGSAYLNTTTDFAGTLFVNESSIPKRIVIESDTTLYLGFRISAKPSTSFVIRPFLYSTKVEENATKIDVAKRNVNGNLMETTLVSWHSGFIGDTGSAGSSPLLEYSDYIDISGFAYVKKTFIYGGSEQGSCGAFYDSSKVFISKLDASNTITIPSNAVYMRINRLSVFAERLRNGNYLYVKGASGSSSKWKGKTISALGDSITYGYGLTNRDTERWTALLANKTGATVNNYGLNSSKVSNITGDEVASFVDRRENVPSSDLIIIFGGTNDYWHQLTAVGTATSYDVATFGGALNYLFNYYQTQYPSKKILYIFPMHQYYSGNPDSHDFGYGSFDAFREVAKGACANSGVPMLDLYATSGTNVAINSTQRSYYTQDGVHPNAVGHALLADLIYTFIEYQMSN
jgi:lysophospholipase L1-like esterase